VGSDGKRRGNDVSVTKFWKTNVDERLGSGTYDPTYIVVESKEAIADYGMLSAPT